MFRKLVILMCLVSFWPAAVGAQELAVLSQVAVPAVNSPEQKPEVNLSLPAARQEAIMMAQNEAQAGQSAAAERPRKTHTGLTFQEFVDVHFGEYRWIYWAAAVAAIVAIHAVAAD